MAPLKTDPALITQAHLYGFPLVFNLDQVNRYVTEGVGANPAAPFNTEQPRSFVDDSFEEFYCRRYPGPDSGSTRSDR